MKMADSPCTVEECDRLVGAKGAKGLCSRHYQRKLATGCPTGTLRPSPEERFFPKVEQDGDCWHWTASRDENGYGLFKASTRIIRAHIWAYEYFIGEVPDGLQLDHYCHTSDADCPGGVTCPHRRCVNPYHLDPVTPAVNSSRGVRTRIMECPQGHRYDEENTYHHPGGSRVCRSCSRLAQARYMIRKKAA